MREITRLQEIIQKQDQHLIDIRQDYDSTIMTRGSDDNTVRPHHVQNEFDELMDVLVDLFQMIVKQMDVKSPDFQKKKSIWARVLDVGEETNGC